MAPLKTTRGKMTIKKWSFLLISVFKQLWVVVVFFCNIFMWNKGAKNNGTLIMQLYYASYAYGVCLELDILTSHPDTKHHRQQIWRLTRCPTSLQFSLRFLGVFSLEISTFRKKSHTPQTEETEKKSQKVAKCVNTQYLER